MDARPFIFLRDDKQIHLGPHGAYHTDIESHWDYPGRAWGEDEGNSVYGRIFPSQGKFDWYEGSGRLHPDMLQTLEQALQPYMEKQDEWKMGSIQPPNVEVVGPEVDDSERHGMGLPFTYDPGWNTLFVGNKDWFHYNMDISRRDEQMSGRVDNNNLVFYDDRFTPEQKEAIKYALKMSDLVDHDVNYSLEDTEYNPAYDGEWEWGPLKEGEFPQFDYQENWRLGALQVKEVEAPNPGPTKVRGLEQRRPWIWRSGTGEVFLGPWGVHHDDLAIDRGNPDPDFPDMEGYAMDTGEVESIGRVPDHVLDAVSNHLGTGFYSSPWRLGSGPNDQLGWDPGYKGKGFILTGPQEPIVWTWRVGPDLRPTHAEKSVQTIHDAPQGYQPTSLFHVTDDGTLFSFGRKPLEDPAIETVIQSDPRIRATQETKWRYGTSPPLDPNERHDIEVYHSQESPHDRDYVGWPGSAKPIIWTGDNKLYVGPKGGMHGHIVQEFPDLRGSTNCSYGRLADNEMHWYDEVGGEDQARIKKALGISHNEWGHPSEAWPSDPIKDPVSDLKPGSGAV